MINFLEVFGLIIIAGLIGGGSAGILGVFVVGLRMPFLAVFSAHAAMAGAVMGELLGLPQLAAGFVGALLGAFLLGSLLRRHDLDPNVVLGSLFSLMMGVAFIGIGISKGPKSTLLGLMWGNLLFVTRFQLIAMIVVAVALAAFISIFEKELKILLFSRELASYIIPENIFFTSLLVFSAGVITINLQTVGGLMLYSLVSNPAVAALRVSRNYWSSIILSCIFGMMSVLGGFLVSYWFNLPMGSCIVIFSCSIVGLVFAVENKIIRSTTRQKIKSSK
ncbi:High-affinity zinc uptake system membrane protein ZnuB [subsurface metagenome]